MALDSHARKAKEQRDGYFWLFGAGAFAVALWGFLFYSDHMLSTSDRDKKLGETLRELRTAQAEVGGGVLDQRQAPHVTQEKKHAEHEEGIDALPSIDEAHHGHSSHEGGEAAHH